MMAAATRAGGGQLRQRQGAGWQRCALALGLLASTTTTTMMVAAQRTGCATNADCPTAQWCHLPDRTCAPPGVCEPRPEFCTMDYTPVCGCDGRTYGNRCGAFAAGQPFRYDGECGGGAPPSPEGPVDVGQPSQQTQTQTQQQASKEEKEEQADAAGAGGGGGSKRNMKRKARELRFGLDWSAATDFLRARVVGAAAGAGGGDKAAAAAAGAGDTGEQQPALPGQEQQARRQPCGSRGMAPCAQGEFCEFVDGKCGETDTGGLCARMRPGCPKIYRPVCGCDGNTYANACIARSQGVSVRFESDCASADAMAPAAAPVTTTNEAAGAGAAGAAAGTTETGAVPPGVVPDADPASSSAAVAPGMGGGKRQSCGGLMGLACPSGQACIYAMEARCGAADQTGLCMTPPTFCVLLYQPVCGCDGNTYSNACHAHAKGVSVSSEGPCDAPHSEEEAAAQEIEKKNQLLANLRKHGMEEVGDAAADGAPDGGRMEP